MWLVVGLGNPEKEYRGTRHNVGFEVADALAERAAATFSEKKFKARLARGRIGDAECVILEPQTFMNLSGESAGPAAGFYKIGTDRVIVVHDELDLELGKVRLKKGGGAGGHNGLRSLIQHLPDPEFIRVRVGIGRPPPAWDGADYVLSKFTKAERESVEQAVKQAADAIEAVLTHGLSRAMNTFNRDPKEAKAPKGPRPQGEGAREDDAKGR
jgi:PTH1 family peptidyl-tRNA hydrolase